VVINHLRSFWWLDYGDLENKSLSMRLFYFLTGYGHLAVVIFFVLSGLLVGGRSLQTFGSKHWNLFDYLFARLARLYPVLFMGLGLTWACDGLGLHYFGEQGLYSMEYVSSSILHSYEEQRNWSCFLGTLAMTQNILTPIYGSNAPLWSLAYEFWFYLLWPMILYLIWGRFRSRMLAVIGIGALAIFLPGSILMYFLLWLLGAMIPLLRLPSWSRWPCALAFLACLVFSRLHLLPEFWNDLLLAFIFSIFLVSFQDADFPFLTAANRILADFSYSVYIFHFPLLLLAVSWLNQTGHNMTRQPSLVGMWLFWAMVLGTYLVAFMLGYPLEKSTPKVRAWLNGMSRKN